MIHNINDYCTLRDGRRIYKHMKLDNKRHSFVCSHGIGDIVWMCSFMQAYLKKSEIKNDIELICCKRDERLIQSYLPFVKIRTLSTEDLYKLGRFVSAVGNDKVRALIYPRLCSGRVMLNNIQILAELGIEMDICYKYGCFDLGDVDNFQFPCLDQYQKEADQVIIDKNLRTGKTIVLVPYVHSRLELDRSDWSKIAEGLIEKGYDVYTNVGSEKAEVISGTRALYIPLELLPLVVKKTGYVISARCGLGDWLFVNGCNMSVIHTFYLKKFPHGSNEQIQSSFGCKESFQNMKIRCGLTEGILQEYRIAVDMVKENNLDQIVSDADTAARRIF